MTFGLREDRQGDDDNVTNEKTNGFNTLTVIFRWDGPVEEKTPPYNIMSTAKPRSQDEDRKFTLEAGSTFETT